MKFLHFIFLFTLGLYAGCNDLQCIFPSQWKSNVYIDIGMVLSFPIQITGNGTFYYDFVSKMMRLDVIGTDFGGTFTNRTVIWRFNDTLVYEIDHTEKSCDIDVIDDKIWQQWQGVPGDAQAGSIGNMGNEGFDVMEYQFTRASDNYTGDVVITLDVKMGDVCSPLHMTIQDKHRDPVGTFAFLYDFLDISHFDDTKIFIPPPNCKKSILPKSNQGYTFNTGFFMDLYSDVPGI